MAVLIIFIGGGIFILSRPQNTDSFSTSTSTPPTQTEKTNTYQMSEVSSHKSEKSCWTTIRGSVYDLTPWISQHPGGAEAIIPLCGTDGTKAFTEQHGGQGKPEQELQTFLIGKLK